MKKKRFWHRVGQKVVDSINGNKTWQYVMDNFKQPTWCNYPEALSGIMGCWTLTSDEGRQKISRKFCKDCECYKK